MAGGVFFTFAESSPRVWGLIAVTDVLERGEALELSLGVQFQNPELSLSSLLMDGLP